VQAGLGVVPFAIDTHASQMGTLVRLIHCVQLGLVEQGWGIDEETQLEVRNGQVTVYGKGHSYLVQRRADGAASVETFVAAG
jgi:cyanophycinase-like exopeptidase